MCAGTGPWSIAPAPVLYGQQLTHLKDCAFLIAHLLEEGQISSAVNNGFYKSFYFYTAIILSINLLFLYDNFHNTMTHAI